MVVIVEQLIQSRTVCIELCCIVSQHRLANDTSTGVARMYRLAIFAKVCILFEQYESLCQRPLSVRLEKRQ